ncbi:disease resistance protein RGA2-like [Chenopodium quinoa]|uniref:disease resistance protein RGA2-like n=1 Tax=Chenopodium quinoa TaxID=63459 RepID=UPI000B7842A8|nr:disease resistance protein RGA2-like [Chenopodium quinoa]
MSHQVEEIRKKLDEIVSNHQKFGLSVDYNPIVRRRDDTYSYVDAQAIIGREHDKKVVIDMLLGSNDVDESIRFLSIVGVGGLGKTALAQLVCNDKEVEAEFPDPKLRLWVCVSDQDGEQFDVRSILCKILELVTDHKPDATATMEWVQKKFQEKLKGRKFLLVLDDVWNEDCEKWRCLYRFLTLGRQGSRIVVTTRSEMTAKIIGEKHVHKLQGLSPENSWLLFESIAFDKGEQELVNHLKLVDIGKKIAEKCYNIPLAIKVVGSLLFGQPLSKWQTFVDSGLAKIGQGDNEVMSILKLSYHNLRPSLKNCFSYCALFPKDAYIKRVRLIDLWMAQGFIVPLDGGQSIEDAAEEHFLILVRRCFFQDVKKDKYGDIEGAKIHDLMHDVALEVGGEEISVVSSNTTILGDKVRHVYFASDRCPQSFFCKSKIRSFILSSHSTSLVDTPIDSWICLRVLYLRSAGMIRLPDSIGKLLHLTYLDLSSNCDLETLTDSITRLNNLQTLVLSDCNNLRELPKDFSKLVKLRHLDLRGCDELSRMPSGMDKLTRLRHLNLRRCELSSMPSGMGKLTNLRVLTLFVVGKEKRGSTEEQRMGDLKDLKTLTDLKGGMRIEIGKYYMNDGEGKYLKSMKHLSKVEIYFYSDDDRCSECEGVMEKLEPSSNIKEFVLLKYMGTKIPRWGRAEDDWAISFQHLVNIKINFCRELEQIPLLSKLRYLKSLSFWGLEKL